MSQRKKAKTTTPHSELPAEGEPAQHYFLRCLLAIVKEAGGQFIVPAHRMTTLEEGWSLIPVCQNNQLILTLSQQPTKVFVMGAQAPPPLSQPLPKPITPAEPVKALATEVDKILQTLEQPRSLVLDDAALVDLEARQRLNANVRDLNRRAPSHAGA